MCYLTLFAAGEKVFILRSITRPALQREASTIDGQPVAERKIEVDTREQEKKKLLPLPVASPRACGHQLICWHGPLATTLFMEEEPHPIMMSSCQFSEIRADASTRVEKEGKLQDFSLSEIRISLQASIRIEVYEYLLEMLITYPNGTGDIHFEARVLACGCVWSTNTSRQAEVELAWTLLRMRVRLRSIWKSRAKTQG
mmetsp:Transcript_5243/g.32981  ORF Transcript_5243/g.32981 Transcript_5243/m.32981 type:complete len:199 (-) Transcript_5243:3481-4077(-)